MLPRGNTALPRDIMLKIIKIIINDSKVKYQYKKKKTIINSLNNNFH